MQQPDLKKYAELKMELQKRELRPPPVNADFYLQLTALHLYYNEPTLARFVWRRIPPEVKAENEHVNRMHYLTSALLSTRPQEFFRYIEWNWPENIKELMSDLKEKIRFDIFKLIGIAYTSIEEQKLAEMTYLSNEQLQKICKQLDWQYITNDKQVMFVLPRKPPNDSSEPLSSEDQLFTLTNFVSFLEN